MPTAQQALKSMYDTLGSHPGCRSGHAKGTFCAGVFTPSGEAAELTTAPHLQGDQHDPVRVTVRFSTVTGDPNRHDGKGGSARGMAVRFHLPNGEYTDLITVSLPCFTNRRPADFVEMNRSCFKYREGRTRFRLLGTGLYLARHWESFKAMKATKLMKPVPSYANCRYNSLNAFVWTRDDQGISCYVRYSWIPVEGEQTLDKQVARTRASDFLHQDLYERLGKAQPIRFWLDVQLASREDRDRVDDPTKVWPTTPERIVPASPGGKGPPLGEDGRRRRVVRAGELTLTEVVEGPAVGDDPFGFGPLNLTDGIGPSEDEILVFRPTVYKLAASDRLGAPERP
jgi:catalase